ncbi:MAG TPA: HAD family hydrolase [Armatimonadota bacterium]|jgi:YrbI family 3-deoxy-D-manno-octulosonate 8-phosphate phosphatase
MSDLTWPAGPIRLLLLDVDGTLTDGGMYFSAEGLALKRFDVRDGLGLVKLQAAGVPVALVSADGSPITAARGRQLGLSRVELRCADKAATVRQILADTGVPAAEACFVGDDLTDLPAFAEVGYTAAPADAVPEVRAAAQYVASRPGGHGAVREIADLIRATQVPS